MFIRQKFRVEKETDLQKVQSDILEFLQFVFEVKTSAKKAD
jgi:hypothetical protein